MSVTGGSSPVVRARPRRRPPARTSTSASRRRPAGFDIFENNFGNVLADAEDQGRAHPHRGPRLRRHRHRAEGRADRDLAGQRRRQVRASGRPPAGQGARPALSRLGPQLHRLRHRRLHASTPIKPGAVEGRNGRIMAPHINVWIVARGINIGLNTRIYFSDEAEANAKDPVLNLIEWEARRKTLVAERDRARKDGGARLPLRHPPAGRGRDGVLRRLRSARRPPGRPNGDAAPSGAANEASAGAVNSPGRARPAGRRRPRRSRAASRSGPTRRRGRPRG